MPRAGLVVGLLLTLCVTGSALLRERGMDRFLETQTYEDLYYLPPPDWLEVFSLGHRRAAADLVWMKALVYIGDEFRARGDVENVYTYARTILHLDPDFRATYKWVAVAGLYRPSETPIEAMMPAVEILEDGVRRFPDDGELAWELGATLLYEIAPTIDVPDERAAIRARGTEHIVTAGRLGGGPPFVALSAASELRRLGRVEQAVRHLEEMYAVVDDEDMRYQIAEQLASLRSRSYSQRIEQAQRDFQRAHDEDFAWLPDDFYVQVGRRPPVDVVELRRRRWASE